MRTWIALFALGLGLLVPGPVALAGATDACRDQPPMRKLLDCWRSQAAGAHNKAGGPVLVELQGPLPLGDLAGGTTVLQPQPYQRAFQAGPLVVSLGPKKRSGPGGTVLLLLTPSASRLVAPDSRLTRLDPATLDWLNSSGVCGDTGIRAICDKLGRGDVSGQELLAANAARDLDQAAGPVGGQAADSGPSSQTILLILLVVLMLAAAALFVRRRMPGRTPQPAGFPEASAGGGPTRVSYAHTPEPPPQGRTRHRSHPGVPAKEPRRQATVRTLLHPQGYVEIDRCLLRAAWADPDVPPPQPGEVVDVVPGTGQDRGLLLAYPTRTGR